MEVITKGFYSAAEVALLESLDKGVTAKHVSLKNSLEASNSHMKVTNVIHMAALLAANLKRGVSDPKVFDLSRVFTVPANPVSEEPRQRESLDYDFEHDVLSLASAGRWSEGEWRKGESLEEHARLFKGALANIIGALGATFSVGKSEFPFLHPGMQASIKMGRNVVGVFGVIHPAIGDACGLRSEALYAEMDARLLVKFMTKPDAVVVSDFPPISRDITLQIDLKEQAGRVVRLINEAQVATLRDTLIVDDFRKAEDSFRRVTYRVTFQSSERTLKHEEVDGAMTGLLDALRTKHGFEMVS